MRIAFYAPLKPPDYGVPSGDRRMAQLFLAALRRGGHEPTLASRLRSYEGEGDAPRQQRIEALGGLVAARFLRRCRAAPGSAPELWFTYHIYHKAPDWLGPPVAEALGIPYVVAEASFAPKQALGCWALGHGAAELAIRRAARVIGLNPADRDCVVPLLRSPRQWTAMAPFLDARSFRDCSFRARTGAAAGPVRLIAVAMMRPGDKLASYRILGDALSRLGDLDWSLDLVGDGDARPEVEQALAPLGRRVHWSGALDAEGVARHLASAELCLWPAVNEAFGMALLEAQAAGLPVVAGRAGGVAEIVAAGLTGLLAAPGDAAAFAAAVRSLIADRDRLAAFGAAARRRVLARHDLDAAARRLNEIFSSLPRRQAA